MKKLLAVFALFGMGAFGQTFPNPLAPPLISLPPIARLVNGTSVPVSCTNGQIYIDLTTPSVPVFNICGSGTFHTLSGTGNVTAGSALTLNHLVLGAGSTAIAVDSACVTDGAGALSCTTLSAGASPPTITGGTAGVWAGVEGTAPNGIAAVDIMYADSTAHAFRVKLNNGSADTVCTIATGCGALTYVTLTDGATITWPLAGVSPNATVTLGGNRTLNITGPSNGGTYVLEVVQDGTGNRTLTLGTGCTWDVVNGGAGAVTLTTTANARDVIGFSYDGTRCLATLGKNFN